MTKLYETCTCTITKDEFGVDEKKEYHIFAVVEDDRGIIVVPGIENTNPDDEPEFVRAARKGFSGPDPHFSEYHYWGDVSRIPDDYFGGLPADVIAAGLVEKAELIAEIDEDEFTLYHDGLGEAGKELFERCSSIERGSQCREAGALYDGGWRAADRDELADEYGLDDEYLDWLVEGLQDIEDEENEEDEDD